MNITHQPSRHRFELEHFPSCYIEYTLEEDVLTVEHTIVVDRGLQENWQSPRINGLSPIIIK